MTILDRDGNIIRGANGKGKRAKLPTLQELAEMPPPWPSIAPADFAKILSAPTPVSPSGASAAEMIFLLYSRIALHERMLTGEKP